MREKEKKKQNYGKEREIKQLNNNKLKVLWIKIDKEEEKGIIKLKRWKEKKNLKENK
jgi:hypothetical protein